ncbi:DEKNAAC100399 [Brettanomyces naardenensis]|uniref:DEKNAAC100399 n=1 Tax=Brettanomyces naardenensis TaxID=13370 RepID=A0A448YEZ8_BRENA|nr:DEKNAAC100399 [Brettanomyces naardenensis]
MYDGAHSCINLDDLIVILSDSDEDFTDIIPNSTDSECIGELLDSEVLGSDRLPQQMQPDTEASAAPPKQDLELTERSKDLPESGFRIDTDYDSKLGQDTAEDHVERVEADRPPQRQQPPIHLYHGDISRPVPDSDPDPDPDLGLDLDHSSISSTPPPSQTPISSATFDSTIATSSSMSESSKAHRTARYLKGPIVIPGGPRRSRVGLSKKVRIESLHPYLRQDPNTN